MEWCEACEIINKEKLVSAVDICFTCEWLYIKYQLNGVGLMNEQLLCISFMCKIQLAVPSKSDLKKALADTRCFIQTCKLGKIIFYGLYV